MSTDPAARVAALREAYADIGGPTPDQWDLLAHLPGDRPLTLLNLFAFRDLADYGTADEDRITGREAFDRYAAVSSPAMERVGGRFVHLGVHLGTLVGSAERWNLVVVGAYPDLEALLALHEDPAYREAYRHRVAACSDQRVLLTT